MNLLITLGVVASAWLIWVDAVRNNIGRQKKRANWLELNYSPGMLACSTLLLWIVVFPLYVKQRKQLIERGSNESRVKKGWFATLCAVILSFGMLLVNGLPFLYEHYGPGFDRILDTSSAEGFQNSYAQISPLLSGEQGEALEWALGDLSMEQLQERYHNATARRIVKGEANNQIKLIAAELEKLASQKAEADAARAELAKVKAEVTNVQLDSGLFGPALKLEAHIVNGSHFAFSRLKWKARLYLNDNKQVTAEANLLTDFSEQSGLRPSQALAISEQIEERAWSTIEVKTAKKLRVELEAIADSATDLGDPPVSG